jgi:hypothetical protein
MDVHVLRRLLFTLAAFAFSTFACTRTCRGSG